MKMKMMFKVIFTSGALLAASSAPVPAIESRAHAAPGVYFTVDEILAEFFPAAEKVEKKPVELTPALCEQLKRRLGYTPRSPDGTNTYPVWVGSTGGVVGYAVIDDEKGMHEPITFAVLIGPDGAVKRQEVLVYRESEGDGVTRKAFRRQFIGKTVKSSLRAGADVTIVSGATISSNSMAVGVRRALTIVDEAFLQNPLPPAERIAGAGH
jgi:Na+-translocating ferredoxin:NAD+ oxidoreductase subunit G